MTDWWDRIAGGESPYQRPNDAWMCGRAAEGAPCRHGPDPRGRCGAGPECLPRRHGDRWYCTRPGAYGGACAEGPRPDGACSQVVPPCVPLRGSRARRGVATRLSVAGVLGCVLVVLMGPRGRGALSSGPMSDVHAALAADCAACHAVAAQSKVWLTDWQSAGLGRQESARCESCHDLGPDALLPHGVPAAALSADGSHAASTPASPLLELAALARRAAARDARGLACASCHREHRGASTELTAMPDARCQSCHARRFADFAAGHPAFKPLRRRETGIAFNHATHESMHFGEAPFNCTECHRAERESGAIGLRGFGPTCGGCHAPDGASTDHHVDEIRDGGSLTLLQLPVLALADAPGFAEWRADAGTVEEELPPLTVLLLAGDDRALPALASLYDEARGLCVEWEPADADLPRALAAALVDLARELAAGRHDMLQQRLANALGADPYAPEVRGAAAELVRGQFAAAAFVERYMQRPAGQGEEQSGAAPGKLAGWNLDADAVAVVYRPTNHADPVLHACMTALYTYAAKDAGDGRDVRARIRRRSLRRLSSAEGGGAFYSACLRCHTLQPAGVQWRAAGHDTSAPGYRTFTHTPHLLMLGGDAACVECHTIDPMAAHEPEVAQGRGFLAHQKATCAACHQPGRAPDACVTCHDYHFVRPGTTTGTMARGRAARRVHLAASGI